MRVTLIAFAIASLIISSSVQAAYTTANELLPLCSLTVKAFDENAGVKSGVAGGYCLGAVHALRTASQILSASQTSLNLRACLPTEVTDLQVVRVAVAYMQKYPARLHEPFEFLVLEALHEAWPCKN